MDELRFSQGIPSGTLVPEWAFLDVTVSSVLATIISPGNQPRLIEKRILGSGPVVPNWQ